MSANRRSRKPARTRALLVALPTGWTEATYIHQGIRNAKRRILIGTLIGGLLGSLIGTLIGTPKGEREGEGEHNTPENSSVVKLSNTLN